MELEIGQKVSIIIGKETSLGFIVLIEESFEGLVYKSEVFSDLEEGITTVGYIKNIREDEKIDVSLRPLGYRNTIEDDKAKILHQLTQKNGVVQLTDKSSPESIKFHLQMSKKAFKRALGALYKEKKVLLHQDRIEKV
ncbi:MAG: DNA-binding protein [Flavobacteriaceae bacterium]|jgi:predicted RNA-binding protein (virulence factor B family)|nr:DNA-binding protein [Flavobacteriaceae bacterium]|tara:strand:+ start:3411 stop:3824 length:414 start_codon:yes stop_codon:yes gene_type:complete